MLQGSLRVEVTARLGGNFFKFPKRALPSGKS